MPHHHYAGIFVFSLLFLLAFTVIAYHTMPTGMITSQTDIIEKKTLPSMIDNCNQNDSVNEYKNTISNDDGTKTVLTYNACYPGCTGISIFKGDNLLSQGAQCKK